MRISQLLHALDKNEAIVIMDTNQPVMRMRVFSGLVRWIHKDNPLNRYHVKLITTDEGSITILAEEQRRK